MSLAKDVLSEVRMRHDFFVDWFTGRTDEAAMVEAARAFAPDFCRIGPDGNVFDREGTLGMLRSAGNTVAAGFSIRTEIGEAVEMMDGLIRVTYDELQHLAGADTARRSTAVFSADARAPCGVVWRFLQETWISH